MKTKLQFTNVTRGAINTSLPPRSTDGSNTGGVKGSKKIDLPDEAPEIEQSNKSKRLRHEKEVNRANSALSDSI